jgi:hypothetical protein
MYEFAWRSPQFGGRLGAAHSVEIPFVFDTLGLGTEPLLGPDPPQSLVVLICTPVALREGEGQWGLPNGYILGEEASGAFIGGVRYGDGTLYTKNAGDVRVFWQGPSLGFDAGAMPQAERRGCGH